MRPALDARLLACWSRWEGSDLLGSLAASLGPGGLHLPGPLRQPWPLAVLHRPKPDIVPVTRPVALTDALVPSGLLDPMGLE